MRLLVLIILFISTLSSNQKLEKISLQLQWLDQFQFAGYYVAKEKGYYKDVGLDVEIKKYTLGDSVTQKVVDNESQYGTGRTSLLIDKSEGKKVYILSAILQSSPLVLVSLKSSGINKIEDFKNKTIMLTGTESSASIFGMTSSNGIDYKDMNTIRSENKLQNLIDKKIDIISAYTSNQVYTLKKQNIDINVFHPKDYGFNFYSDILFTNESEYKNHHTRVHHFNEASLKGWKYAFDNIEETVDLILNKYNTQNKTKEALIFEANELKKLAYYKTNQIGNITKEKIQSIYDIYRIMKFIKNPIDIDELILDENHYSFTPTANEKNYLGALENLQVCVKTGLYPLDGYKNDEHVGIIGDIFKIISKKLDVSFQYELAKDVKELNTKIRDNKCDVISIMAKEQKSFKSFNVTDVFIEDYFAVLTSLKESFINNKESLRGKKLVTRYESYKNYIQTLYPYLNIQVVNDLDKIVELVTEKKVYGVITLNQTSDILVQRYGYGKLKVNGFLAQNQPIKGGIGIINTKPILLNIFNKAIYSIKPETIQSIKRAWQLPKYITKLDHTLAFSLLALFIFVLLLLIYRHKKIANYNAQLNKQKELYNVVLENTLDGVTIFDPITRQRIDCNQQAIKTFGYESKEEMLKILPASASPEFQPDGKRSDEKAEEIFNTVAEKGTLSYEWLHVNKSGEEFLIEATLTSLNVNNKNIVYALWRDITEKKETEKKIIYQAQIIEQVHESIIATDLEGYITYWNKGSEITLNYDAHEMIGKHISNVYLKEDLEKLKHNISELKEKGKHNDIVRLVKKSKNVIFAELSLSLLKNEKNDVIGMIGYSKDITKRKKAEDELAKQKTILRHQANHDALTGLPNRSLFNDRLEQSIQKAKRNKTEFALFFIDLDNFKHINDSLGHDIGDKVLIAITQLLQETIREEDTLARLGGDEFTIITENLTKTQDTVNLAQKIIDALAQSISIDDYKLYITSSIGISLYPKDSKNTHNLLKYADTAMYKAKDEGKNNYQFYSKKMTQLVFEQVAMNNSLRNAIKNEEFIAYYQPQIHALTNEVIGVEALMRWQHPTMGLVTPDKFIQLAEDSGMIIDIDKLMMKITLPQVAKWYKEKLNPGVLSLNLSMKQLKEKNFIETVENSIAKYDFNSKWLGLEITEGDVMQDPENSIIKLTKLRDIGIKVSIDDFGTGYSSLSYLKRLPIQTLKIDQSFIKDVPEDEEDLAIVKAIIALSKSLNIDVIAEGVENEKQLSFLLENDCNNIQGYYYAKPMPADEMKIYLEKNHKGF